HGTRRSPYCQRRTLLGPTQNNRATRCCARPSAQIRKVCNRLFIGQSSIRGPRKGLTCRRVVDWLVYSLKRLRCGWIDEQDLRIWRFPQSGGVTMKLALITLGLLATTGVVYAACMFC